MSKTYDIKINDELDFSLGEGLAAITTSGIFDKFNKKKSPGEKFWDDTKTLAGKTYKAGFTLASHVADKVSDSAIGNIVSDAIDKSEGKLRSLFTANGRAKVNLDRLLHPSNNNGIELGVKLELAKLNSKLRSSGVPEKHIEGATLLYLSALESSGDKNLAKQFYLVKLRDSGVSGDHIVKCIKMSLGPQAIEWIKVAAAIGLIVGGVRLVTSKPVVTGAIGLIGGTGKLAAGLIGGATKLATGILGNAVSLVR